MSEIEPNEAARESTDRALTTRLRKLRLIRFDTSRLERAVETEIAAGRRQTNRAWWAGVFQPTRAIAASVLVVISIVSVVMLTASSGPVRAEAVQMATMHRDLIAGKTPVTKVNSIEAAERALATQWPRSPELPDLPDDHVMACCLRRIENKKVACVLLNDSGTPVSMMVADGTDVKAAPSSTTVVRGGITYHVEASGELNMVMSKQGDRWVCLIGERPVERLIELSGGLKF